MSNIKKVAVIGTGVIGVGWIIRCLAHNTTVYAIDSDMQGLKVMYIRSNELKNEGVLFTKNLITVQATFVKLLSHGNAALNQPDKEVLEQFYKEKSFNYFNIISCQMSLHYACENELNIRTLIHNIYENLAINGYFIGTILDGMSVFKVMEAAKKAGDYVRNGKGPYILEVQTYRYRGHSMSDAQQYRTKDEVNEYRKIDPITQVKKVILENDFATEQEISNIDRLVKEKVLECEKFAEDSPYPEKNVMYDAVYEEENYNFISHKLK